MTVHDERQVAPLEEVSRSKLSVRYTNFFGTVQTTLTGDLGTGFPSIHPSIEPHYRLVLHQNV
jgi:hypothetical protein